MSGAPDAYHRPDEPCTDECPWDSCALCGGYHCAWTCPDLGRDE